MLGCIPRTPSPDSEDVNDEVVALGSAGNHNVRKTEIQDLRVSVTTRQQPHYMTLIYSARRALRCWSAIPMSNPRPRTRPRSSASGQKPEGAAPGSVLGDPAASKSSISLATNNWRLTSLPAMSVTVWSFSRSIPPCLLCRRLCDTPFSTCFGHGGLISLLHEALLLNLFLLQLHSRATAGTKSLAHSVSFDHEYIHSAYHYLNNCLDGSTMNLSHHWGPVAEQVNRQSI